MSNTAGVDFFFSAGQTAAWGRLVGRHRVQKRCYPRLNHEFETQSPFSGSAYSLSGLVGMLIFMIVEGALPSIHTIH